MKLCAKVSGSTYSVEHKSSIHNPPENETVKRLRVRVGNAVYDFGLTKDREAGKQIAPFVTKDMDQNLYFGQRMTQDEVIVDGDANVTRQNVLYENNAAFSNIGDQQMEEIGTPVINDRMTSHRYQITSVTNAQNIYEDRVSEGYLVTYKTTFKDWYSTKASTTWASVYGDKVSVKNIYDGKWYNSTQAVFRGFMSNLSVIGTRTNAVSVNTSEIHLDESANSFYVRFDSATTFEQGAMTYGALEMQDARYAIQNTRTFDYKVSVSQTSVPLGKLTYRAASFVSSNSALKAEGSGYRSCYTYEYKSKGATYTKPACTLAQTYSMRQTTVYTTFVASYRSTGEGGNTWDNGSPTGITCTTYSNKATIPGTNQTIGVYNNRIVYQETTRETSDQTYSKVSLESTNYEYRTYSLDQVYASDAFRTPNYTYTHYASADVLTKEKITYKSTTTHNFAT